MLLNNCFLVVFDKFPLGKRLFAPDELSIRSSKDSLARGSSREPADRSNSDSSLGMRSILSVPSGGFQAAQFSVCELLVFKAMTGLGSQGTVIEQVKVPQNSPL